MRIPRYGAALPVLAGHGLVPGPGGFDPADLRAAADERGWRASAEPSTVAGPRRWRASVIAQWPAGSGPRGVLVGGTHAHGATEAEALALALARMLVRGGAGKPTAR